MARTQRAVPAALVAPGSTIPPVPLSQDPPADVRRRRVLAALRFGSREACVLAVETLARAAVGDLFTDREYRRLLAACREGAALWCDRQAPSARANRADHALREGRGRAEADPEAPPEPEPEPEDEPEPTFEERLEAAERERERAARGR